METPPPMASEVVDLQSTILAGNEEAMTRRRQKRKMQTTESVVIPGPNVVASLTLPEDSRFVMFMRGEKPYAVPIDEPGTYEIDALPIKPDTPWPVIIMIVPVKHVGAFENMRNEQVSSMIDQSIQAPYQ